MADAPTLKGPYARVRFRESLFFPGAGGEVDVLPPLSLTRAGDEWFADDHSNGHGLRVSVLRADGTSLVSFAPWANVRDALLKADEPAKRGK